MAAACIAGLCAKAPKETIANAKGCRRIGFAVDPRLEARTGHRWLGAYSASCGPSAARWVCPVVDGDPCLLKVWVKKERIDGLLTIHEEVVRALRGLPVRVAGLNHSVAMPGVWANRLDPGHIGTEGVRLVHHALLQLEWGLPQEPKQVTLRGSWSPG